MPDVPKTTLREQRVAGWVIDHADDPHRQPAVYIVALFARTPFAVPAHLYRVINAY